MPYLLIDDEEYLVAVAEGRGRRVAIEQRRRALDGSLLVETIATKLELPVTISGPAAAGRLFTVAEAEALMDTLSGGFVSVSGDLVGGVERTMRAKDVGWVDVDDPSDPDAPTVARVVSATLEEL